MCWLLVLYGEETEAANFSKEAGDQQPDLGWNSTSGKLKKSSWREIKNGSQTNETEQLFFIKIGYTHINDKS